MIVLLWFVLAIYQYILRFLPIFVPTVDVRNPAPPGM